MRVSHLIPFLLLTGVLYAQDMGLPPIVVNDQSLEKPHHAMPCSQALLCEQGATASMGDPRLAPVANFTQGNFDVRVIGDSAQPDAGSSPTPRPGGSPAMLATGSTWGQQVREKANNQQHNFNSRFGLQSNNQGFDSSFVPGLRTSDRQLGISNSALLPQTSNPQLRQSDSGLGHSPCALGTGRARARRAVSSGRQRASFACRHGQTGGGPPS